MAKRYFTTTHISRLFESASRGIAQINTVRSDGSYCSSGSSLGNDKCVWAWYTLAEPDTFQHESGFRSAMMNLANDGDGFVAAIVNHPAEFAFAVTVGHDLGRVVSRHTLFDGWPGIAAEHRDIEVCGDGLCFCTYEHSLEQNTPDQIFRYVFDIAKLELGSPELLVTVDRR